MGLLFGHPERAFYLRQLARLINSGIGASQRELKQLTELGLIVRRRQGNQVLYQANSQSPVFDEIKSLVTKTVGVGGIIRSALTQLEPQIKVAFVYGSVARQSEKESSDIDLMVLGEASFSDVVAALGPAERSLGREINPTVFPVREFREKVAARNHFLNSVMRDKKIFLIGSEDELTKLAAK